MRTQLNLLDIAGVVVIGEGERDEAPMLYIGEEVGTGNGPGVDIALDPLEGTTLIAMGPRGSMLHAPDVYMDKLAIGPGFAPDIVTLEMSPADRVRALAKAKGCETSDINVCILERPRHEEMIAEVRSTKASIRLITDGDVAGVMHCADPEHQRCSRRRRSNAWVGRCTGVFCSETTMNAHARRRPGSPTLTVSTAVTTCAPRT